MVAGSNGGCCGWQLGWWCCAVGSGVGMVVTVGGSGCYHGDLVAATVVWLEVAAVGGVKWRVRGGGFVDQIDRKVGKLFGFAGKSPPEKFSGGGGRRWWRWPTVVGWERK
nr:hypothetical protein [Tanacetum cinerariifolium]